MRTIGVRRLAVLVAVAAAGVMVVGAQAASAQVIEICKSSANGMSGRGFSYTVAPSGGSSFSVGPVAGGRCSGPISVAGATAVITEQQSDPATDVKSVTVRPSNRKLSEDLGNRRVTVTTGASTSSETLVTFVNQPAGGNYGTLKVCKLTETPAYLGRSFSFSVNGGPIVSTEANDAFADPASYSCRLLGTFQVGSIVNVHEQIPSGTEVQWIDTDPGDRLLDFNTSSGDATIQIGAGVTIAYYDDEPTPPAGNGWLEVCKNVLWSDPDISGPFGFTVTDATGATHELTVLAGQCSEPIQVAAGVNQVDEHPKAGTDLTNVAAFPDDRLLTVNLINRTATVEVPVSDSSNDETQVHFTNKAQRGQLKICKALGPGSADLIGHDFYFGVSGGSTPLGIEITAGATTQCKIAGFFPIGATLNVDEQFGNQRCCVAPGYGDELTEEFIDVSGEGPVTIAPGINTKTITNTATGRLEICKAPVDDPLARTNDPIPTFQFRIDGGGIIKVQSGKCSPPKKVSVGNHTVTEVADPRYELDASRTDGGIGVFPADRLVSKNLPTRTVTVSVPWAGNGGETLVTFHNRVKQWYLKLCKTIPLGSQDALGNKEFEFGLDAPISADVFLKPGECAIFGPYPLPSPSQDDYVFIDEAGVANVECYAIDYAGSTGHINNTITGNVGQGCETYFTPGPGINFLYFRNRSVDP